MTDLPPLPRYVLAHFTDDDESLYLATSTDGTTFEALNGGGPALESAVGSRTMRDPFVGRGLDGRFHLVATDGWRSTSIVHASSDDLISWSEPELIELMAGVDGTLNTWAPEFFRTRQGEIRLIWSSTVAPSASVLDPQANLWRDVEEPQQIWHATTTDFQSFSTPSVFYAPGHSVIDASAYVDDDFSLLSFKDERGENREGTDHKDLHFVALDDAGMPIGDSWPASSPHLVEGPNVYRVGRELRLIFDIFLTPDYGALASVDGHTWRTTELVVPPITKHASVLALTSAESVALAARLR